MAKAARVFLHASVIVMLACSLGVTYEPDVQSAADEAHTLAGEFFAGFALETERGVPSGSEPAPTKVKLKQGMCYRILAVRAPAEETVPIKLNFSHKETIVEMESDFIELSEDDGDLRKQRVVWGTCVWPTLEGELTIYDNMSDTGGYILVMKADARTLNWKAGRDVRMYLVAKGAIDIEALEKQDAEPRLTSVFQEHHNMLPPVLYESYPGYSEIVSTTQTGWSHHLTFKPNTCYHLFIASLNCKTEYEISSPKTGDVVHHDGAPFGVGRLGWGHDFCPEKKQAGKSAVLKVKLGMDADDYDKCWFTVALYDYQADAKEKKQLKAEIKEERTMAQGHVDECMADRIVCESYCDEGEQSCLSECALGFQICADDILFEGQYP